MANLNLFGQTLSNVSAFELPTTGGSTATFTEGGGGNSVTQDAQGYIVIPPTGSGGGGGGGGTSATQHIIHLEFSDSTDTDIDVYYDDALIGTMITAYEPTTYGAKTVTLAQLDGITWYEPANIPLNTELIDYSACLSNTAIDSQGNATSTQWYYASDYTAVENGMTFSYTCSLWHYVAFYNSSKAFISSIYAYSDATVDPSDSNTGHGTLSGSEIPSNAAYVRLCGTATNSAHISLIRTA